MTDQPKPFEVEVPIAAEPDTVWPALTVPEQVDQWFGWDYAGLAAEITYIFVDHAKHEPPNRVAFGNGSYLELVPDGPRTVVRAVLPGSLDDADWADLYDGVEEGWRSFLEQLRFLLETRPRGSRRTIFLSGTASVASALAAAGVDQPGTQAWHSSRYLRMWIDASGHLVAAGGQAPLSSQTTAPVGVTVSTYGLDDAAFAAVRAEWAQRWQAVPDGKITTGTQEMPE